MSILPVTASNALRICCAIGLCLAAPLQAQDAELTLLTLEGDLIGRIEAPDPQSAPSGFLDAYYALLPEAERSAGLALRRQLQSLVPDYNVAYTAADAAELTQVKSDIDALIARLHALHARYFTSEVEALLNAAIDGVMALVGPKP